MTGTNCWISPRPFPLTPTELAEFKGILKGLDPNYYSIRFYSSGARALTDDDPMGTAGCYTNTEWGYIDAEVKKEGTSNAAAFVVNTGRSCFDTSSAQGVDFVQQVTKFFDDRRRAASKKAQ
ncbi:MAG: hypothetical protein ACJ8JD_03005 [Chthoniobacterales bacterium]